MVKPAAKRFLWSPDGRRWFVCRKGQYHRIHAEPGTEDFDRAYWEVLRGKVVTRNTWAQLIDHYRVSPKWAELKPRTRQDYDKCFDYLREKAGGRDMTRTTAQDAIAAMDANAHRVRFGNYVVSVMSVLAEHARELGWIKANPFKGLRKRKMPAAKKAAHLPWTDEAVSKWRAEALPLPRLIYELGLGSVQRPDDWTRFRWSDYDGERLRVRQSKTGKALTLPCTAELRAALDQARPVLGGGEGAILRKADGNPMSYRPMSWVMLQERKRLGLEAYDLHALRYRGLMELAWAGCDDDEIMSYSGHNTKAMVALYAGQARQVMRAETAAEKRGNRYGVKKNVIRALIRIDGMRQKT